MRRNRSQSSGQRAYVYRRAAAEILGISHKTFIRNLRKGYYQEIRRQSGMYGMLWDMEDVFRFGYPMADGNTIALLIWKFRKETRHQEIMYDGQ